jgi:hypothetical protein
MPSYTPNYNLYLPSRLDETIEVDTSLSDNFTTIDTEIKNRANEIGTLANLTTSTKTDLVSAVNEHDSEIGDLSTLTTTDKTTIVAAINEVKGNTDTNTTNIGTLSNLTTTNKSNLVDAVNEVNGEVDTNTTNIGTLSNLTTTDKSNLVNAINEINNQLLGIAKGISTTSGDGAATTVNIAHGLGSTPVFYQVQAGSADAGTAEISHITADSTNITVTFKNALPSGTDNIVLIWRAEQ